MKNKLRWAVTVVLVLLALLAIVAVIVLPRLVDAESYRGLLRSNLQRQVGRDVEFGKMELSLWPVLGLRLDDLVIGRTPAERFDKPLVAESLRVGARLLPLLRGRLEVTSLTIEGPVLSVYRHDDGTFEPTLPSAADPKEPAERGEVAGQPKPSEESPLVIEQLRVKGARLIVRWEDAGRLRETALEGLALSLDGFGTNGPVAFDLATRLGVSGTLRGSGSIRWADDAAGQPARISARVGTEDAAPETLREWLAALAPTVVLPEGLPAARSFSADADVEFVATRPARLAISAAAIRGPGLLLARSATGVWNYESLFGPADAAEAGAPEELAIHVSDLTIEGASVRIEDRSARGAPAMFELSPLRLELRQPSPEAAIEIDLDATGGVEGQAVLKGRLVYEPANAASPGRVRGTLEGTGVDPRDLRLATTLASFPDGGVVGRRFSMAAEIDARLSEVPDVTLRNVKLRDLDLAVERDAAGAWTFGRPPPAAKATPASKTTSAPSFRVEGFELTRASLRLTAPAAAGAPAVLNLSGVRVSLDRLPTSGPAALQLEAQVGPGKDAKLALRGTLGPLGNDAAAMPLDLTASLVAISLGDVGFLLPPLENLDVSRAGLTANLSLAGTFNRALNVRGEASLSNGAVAFVSPQGVARTRPFDLLARGDLVLRDAAAKIELPKLELELPREKANRVLALRGSVRTAPVHIDLELLPTRVAADDLAALAAIFAPDAPLSFTSPNPVDLELRARGPLGGETLPDLEGKATLSGFTFRVAGMTQPMERVGAKVTFAPDRVTLDGLGGVIGKSDVTASRVVVTNFEQPRLQVELKSQNADFWELFSFLESNEGAPGEAAPSQDDPLQRLTVEGTLRIERGSLQTLNFETLTAGMDFRGNVLTLSSLEMSLYGGRFSGKLVQDLNAGVLTILGNGVDVDTDGFLTQNLALGGLISGRASTDLNVKVVAADPANLLAGVSGGGPLQLADGRLAKLDVLKSLSKVTGIFGERSLQRLTKQLATAGTPFRRAETTLRFDAGTLAFEDLVIETAELTLAGRAAVDSATGKLEGRFAVAFSPELSAAMREEQSRAAGLFWDAKSQRVSFGFGVGGLATAPKVSVDWEGALRGAAERRLGDRLRGLVDRKLGVSTPGGGAPAGDPAPSAPKPPAPAGVPDSTPPTLSDPGTGEADEGSTAGAAAAPAAPATPSEDAPGLAAAITLTRWTGPVLLRDLSLEGSVRGAKLARASLTVSDARGVEIQKIDRLRTLDDQLAQAADQEAELTIPWNARIEGKRLLVARFPVKISVTVYDREGRSATATREVER